MGFVEEVLKAHGRVKSAVLALLLSTSLIVLITNLKNIYNFIALLLGLPSIGQ